MSDWSAFRLKQFFLCSVASFGSSGIELLSFGLMLRRSQGRSFWKMVPAVSIVMCAPALDIARQRSPSCPEAKGSPPVMTTWCAGNLASWASSWFMGYSVPASVGQAYLVSHQWHRIGQPASLMNAEGTPASDPSP